MSNKLVYISKIPEDLNRLSSNFVTIYIQSGFKIALSICFFSFSLHSLTKNQMQNET